MELKEGDYIVGAWVGDCPGSDFLMTLIKRGKDWIVEYRFRDIVDDLLFEDSKDKKRFFGGTLKNSEKTEEEIIKDFEAFFKVVKTRYRNLRFLEVNGNYDRFMYVMALEDFGHIKRISAEEAKKFTKEDSNG